MNGLADAQLKKWAFISNALTSLAILIPVTIFAKCKLQTSSILYYLTKFQLVQRQSRPNSNRCSFPCSLIPPSVGLSSGAFSPCSAMAFVYVSCTSLHASIAHKTSPDTIPTYATQALGFTQSQASILQSVYSAGQMVGRPAVGLALDKFGRINMAALCTFVTGVEILLLW